MKAEERPDTLEMSKSLAAAIAAMGLRGHNNWPMTSGAELNGRYVTVWWVREGARVERGVLHTDDGVVPRRAVLPMIRVSRGVDSDATRQFDELLAVITNHLLGEEDRPC